MAEIPLTWLGHASFRLDTPRGKRLYIDPWLSGPTCPETERDPERVDVIAVTHGHDDHAGDTLSLWQRFSPRVVAMVEVRAWLHAQGLDTDMESAMNKGGTVTIDDPHLTMTDAKHSSSAGDGTYLGEAAGYVIRIDDGPTLYVSGDTAVFGDMELIGDMYEPDVAILPIGGHFTMNPEGAAVALELLGVERCIPSHYGTFPLLTGTPDELRRLAPDVEILAPEPGGTVLL